MFSVFSWSEVLHRFAPKKSQMTVDAFLKLDHVNCLSSNEHFGHIPNIQYIALSRANMIAILVTLLWEIGRQAPKPQLKLLKHPQFAQQQGTRCFCFRIKYHQRYRIDAHGKTLWNAWSWLWGYLRWFEYATWATLLEDRVRKNSTRKCHTEILNSSNFNDCLALKERATLCLHSDGWHQLLEFPLLAARQRLLKRPMRGVLSELCYHRVLQLGMLISRTSTKWRFEILLWAEIHGQAHK